MSSKKENKQKSFPPVLPDLNAWPIVQLSRDRAVFARSVEEESMQQIRARVNGSLMEELERTLFQENIRIKEQHWQLDPEDEPAFWRGIKDNLLKLSHADKNTQNRDAGDVLREIVERYTEEIAGRFNIAVYRFAHRILPIGFYPLLNAPVYLNFLAKKSPVRNKIDLTGDIEKIRKLSKTCTLVMVPTHFSNLDSVIMGWAIGIMGMPSFLYGAGQNLFGIKLFSFFMNYLGSYKVDRRKKNLIYLETLKAYSRLAIERGCHSLFFPGGRRSRSGSIESRLKLGLLGTALDAQYQNLVKANKDQEAKKIVIVPVVLNYHFVLEAPLLIEDHLKTTGKENYLIDENDKFSTSYEMLKVIFNFFTEDSEFSLSFGECMDVFGNPVDENGKSIGHLGREIQIRDYFLSHGELKHDHQRNSEYVRMLGDKIMGSFKKENTVFSSHIVTFAAFELLKRRFPKRDIYDLVRLSEDERVLKYEDLKNSCGNVFEEIKRLVSADKLRLASHLERECEMNLDKIVQHGLKNAGVYHARKVLMKHKKDEVSSDDLKLLFYYHNRLEGYGLEKFI